MKRENFAVPKRPRIEVPSWFLPSAALTGALLLVGEIIGNLHIRVMIQWLTFSTFVLFGVLLYLLFRRMRAGAPAFGIFIEAIPAAALLVLGGLATPAYNVVKTWLNTLGFWADPLLAEIDLALFGWLYIEELSTIGSARFYFFGWFVALGLTLALVPLRRANIRRDALILAYFVIWCLVSPIVQWLLPAGGPVFYERLGYGDTFADYPYIDVTVTASNYLWSSYERGISALSTGISAMPSLHVASSAWVALAWFRRPAFPVALIFALAIFVLSVALGWHYALDGVVGAGIAVFSYWLSYRFLKATAYRGVADTPAKVAEPA